MIDKPKNIKKISMESLIFSSSYAFKFYINNDIPMEWVGEGGTRETEEEGEGAAPPPTLLLGELEPDVGDSDWNIDTMKMKDEENEREKVTDKEAEKYLYLKRIRISNTSGIDAMPGTSPDIERRRKTISRYPTCILT